MHHIIEKLFGKQSKYLTEHALKIRFSKMNSELRRMIRDELRSKTIRIKALEDQVELDRKRINKLEDDFVNFGTFISEMIRLSRSVTKDPGQRMNDVEALTRKFFSHKYE
jgi:predicted  nucleic acid-binding Zn-ribbon protein